MGCLPLTTRGAWLSPPTRAWASPPRRTASALSSSGGSAPTRKCSRTSPAERRSPSPPAARPCSPPPPPRSPCGRWPTRPNRSRSPPSPAPATHKPSPTHPAAPPPPSPNLAPSGRGTPHRLATTPATTGVPSQDPIASSPDGHTLATATARHTVSLWDLSTPSAPRYLTTVNSTGQVAALEFSPAAPQLAYLSNGA